jgi:hypothetical protein
MLTKLIFTVVVVFLAWKAFSVFSRIQVERKARAEQDLEAEANRQSGVEDMVECKVCATFTPKNTKSCGKAGCPFSG